ncbi:Membrane-associated phosphatidylinositol transfer protein 2 [Galemys pyrenaicus]|uniref:Membrane-associated phosphatidylinositol transfer protein 2 n=1 Tax=Galemys pyrenaicus TaxID=202257 RepID=A0A8J6A9R8_GALPY|nr:Membrane-associated phosphatidylinositol transfer protein 2 [Galemys pyrenaicus]
MIVKEYRIPLPMTVEEYRIAQLYMIQVGQAGGGLSAMLVDMRGGGGRTLSPTRCPAHQHGHRRLR